MRWPVQSSIVEAQLTVDHRCHTELGFDSSPTDAMIIPLLKDFDTQTDRISHRNRIGRWHQQAGFALRTSSGFPPTLVATTGKPLATAPGMVLNIPFLKEGRTMIQKMTAGQTFYRQEHLIPFTGRRVTFH